jgi:cytosine deaminase
MLDLLITQASLPDGRTNMSVGVQDGRIVAVDEGLSAPAFETVDAAGQLLSPPFVRPALPHGRHAELRPAAREPKRHPARRHCAVGRTQTLLTADAIIERA